MESEKTNAQMRKGILDYCILLIISRKDAYVPDVISLLKDSGLHVVEGTLYPLLMRLKNNGCLDYRWEESSSGPPRKYYKITEMGLQILQELDRDWHELEESIHYLKNYKPE
ncbi:MAG: PadR family transcriptional regulator [Bacteroidales bacterium]|nr:PadR family transcriptional regulator [Bacteroidales bacterium]HOY39305.1 PadR family transcriptional regulator [Bacteroidales bacterium]HQP04942.1 PadR family transcriptional regulator [Bacteroidales bacterium]